MDNMIDARFFTSWAHATAPSVLDNFAGGGVTDKACGPSCWAERGQWRWTPTRWTPMRRTPTRSVKAPPQDRGMPLARTCPGRAASRRFAPRRLQHIEGELLAHENTATEMLKSTGGSTRPCISPVFFVSLHGQERGGTAARRTPTDRGAHEAEAPPKTPRLKD